MSRESKSTGRRRSRSQPADRRRGVSLERQQPSSDHSHGTNSSSDDIRSFCDSISSMAGKLGRSLSAFGWQPGPAVVSQPHPVPTSSRYHGLQGLGRTYVEPAEMPQLDAGMTVSYDSVRDVQELTYLGVNSCMEKQSKRGARNPWRQYGAVRKLHEIGGLAPEKMDKKSRKKSANFMRIRRGSTPPPPPTTPEIVLNGGKDVSILRSIHIPSGVPAEQLAQSIAVEMQRIARDMLVEQEHSQQMPSSEGSRSRVSK